MNISAIHYKPRAASFQGQVFRGFSDDKSAPPEFGVIGINETESDVIREKSTKLKVVTGITTLIGTLIPVLMIGKSQGKVFNKELFQSGLKGKFQSLSDMLDVNYDLKEMIFVAIGSLAGGLLGGVAADEKVDRTDKIDEGVYQFLNILLPTSIMGGLMKATSKYNNFLVKLACFVTGVVVGMPVATGISNVVDDKFLDKVPDGKRRIKAVDMIVHVDDFAGALILAKVPFVEKLQLQKIVPMLYGFCGYNTGTKT